MDQADLRNQLHHISDVLLEREASGEALLNAVRTLSALLENLSPVKYRDPLTDPDREGTRLAQGEAVSPSCAARCSIEPLRVARFVQGVEQAIRIAQSRFPNGTLHLLYAGTGPYATLVMPLLTRYSPAQLQLTLLDYHAESLDSVRSVLSALGFDAFARGYVQADASQYHHPQDDPIHIAVSETMAAGLQKEMQVPITLNLAPQLAEGGIWLPQVVRVNVVLAEPREFLVGIDYTTPPPYPVSADVHSVATVFEIDARNPASLAKPHAEHLPAAGFESPSMPGSGLELFLTTEIVIYDDIVLTGRDSTLNHPLCPAIKSANPTASRLQFSYRLGQSPGLEAVAE